MADIPIVGVPSSWRYPGGYAQILFGQGPSTAAGGRRQVCFVMPMLASGATWTANTLYRVRSASQAETGGGPGSPIHRALLSAITSNKNADYYAVPYLPPTTGAAAATLDVVFSVTATGTGTATITGLGQDCSFVYRSGDTPTVIGAGVANAVNGRTSLPFTATNASGTVTLASKILGVSQGDGTTGQYQIRGSTTPSTGTLIGGTTAITGKLGDTVPGSDGSTPEATALNTALGTLVSTKRYYIGISANDATSLTNVKTRISSASEPIPGFRERAFAAFTGTLAAAKTLAIAKNYERLALAWAPKPDSDVASIVGNVCACFQADEEITSAASFDLYRGSPFGAATWNVLGTFDPATRPTGLDCNDAINSGVMPIGTDDAGSFIVMAVTTRSKNAAGTQDDFRAAEPHRVSIADDWTERLLARDAATWGNALLQDDKLLDPTKPRVDSNIDTNQRLPVIAGRKVVTPFNFKKWLFGELDQFADGHFQAVDAMKATARVQRDPANTGRIEVGMDLRCVDIAHQRTFALAEVSPG